MIRRLVLFALLALAAVWFYRTFMAETMGGFFGQHSGKVDFLQKNVGDYDIKQ